MLHSIASRFSKHARTRRGKIFIQCLNPTEQDRILDLGGGDGSHLASIIPFRANVTIADIYEAHLRQAAEQYGFHTTILNESGHLPFPDNYFDIVFCSSVIEHITIPKNRLRSFQTNHEFYAASFTRQQEFANEIRRISRRYFVQTPHKYFILESHSWMPVFIVFLPRRWQIKLLDFLRGWWPKATEPDWNLLTPTMMQSLFPEAEIILERKWGMAKSIMAVKR